MKQTLEGKKELKDFLPFYLGCEVWDSYNERKGVLFGVDLNTSGFDNVKVLHKVVWNLSYECVKPLLRRLEDMTDEELFEYGNIEFPEIKDSFFKKGLKETLFTTYFSPAAFKFLLSRHFDLFNLIPEGLAIDIKTLK